MKVIVVGAGIAGLSTAWALTKRGHQVTLVEQGPIPNPLAASGDHHRIIRRAYRADTGYGNAISEAFEAWDEVWDTLGRSHYDPRGFMAISREPGDEAEDYLQGLEAGGFPFEKLDAEESVERWPFLMPGSFRYAFVSSEGGALHCRQIATGLADWLRGSGAEILEHAKVTAIDTEACTVAIDAGDSLSADRIVVTAGAWVPLLFPHLALDLATYRTAVVYLEPPADLKGAWADAPVILDVGGQTDGYIIPPTGGAGLKFGSGISRQPLSDAGADRAPRPGEGEGIRDLFQPPVDRIAQYEVADVASCAYTFTTDERFFATAIGRSIVVSACSGHGYKFGAAVGRRVAQAVEDDDIAALRRWLRAEAA